MYISLVTEEVYTGGGMGWFRIWSGLNKPIMMQDLLSLKSQYAPNFVKQGETGENASKPKK